MKPEIKKGFLILMLMAGLVSIVWTGVSFAEIRLAVAPFEMEPIEEKTIIPCRYCGNNPTGNRTHRGGTGSTLNPLVVGPSFGKS